MPWLCYGLNIMSIRFKLLSALILSSFVAIGIIGYLGYSSGKNTFEEALFVRLSASRDSKDRELENYFGQIREQVIQLSEDQMIINAMRGFKAGFHEADSLMAEAPSTLEEVDGVLSGYYSTQYLSRLNGSIGNSFELTDVWPADEETRYWQYQYIARNPHPVGSKHELPAANDGSAYSEAHATYHPFLRQYMEQFGYYDVFLVDDKTGHVVYSAYKEMDFATSLISGPYKDSNLAEVFDAVRHETTPGNARLIDFKKYTPSYLAPASFIAAPIIDGGERIGVIIFQVPINRINDIMSGHQGWKAEGFGITGETYLVGEDRLMRSVARGLAENKVVYLEDLKAQGYNSDTIAYMTEHETSILYQEIDTDGVRRALAGDSSTQIIDGYRGHRVLSAFKPLGVPDVRWVVISEIAEEEAQAPSRKLAKLMGGVTLAIMLVIVIIALLFTRTLTRPINALRDASKRMAEGDASARVDLKRADELGQLGDAFNGMVANIQTSTRALQGEKEKAELAIVDAERAKSSAEEAQQYLAGSVERMLGAIEKFAQGDLTVELKVSSNDEIGRLFVGFNRAVANVRSMIVQVNEAVTLTTRSASSIRTATDQIANDVREQSTQVMDIAAAVEEMSMTIADNARTATETADLSDSSGKTAEESGAVVQQTVKKIQEIAGVVQHSAQIIERLGKSSNQIGEIVSVIDAIAEQTNLLALNAAIEAARAGEQGKGFAVVADEVRKLAERTTHSTQQIADMIRSIQTETNAAVHSMKNGRLRVDEGLELADRAGLALQNIEKNIVQTIGMVAQMAAATEEQAQTSSDISNNVASVSQISTNSARGATEIAGAANELGHLTDNLRSLVSQFVVDKKQLASTRETVYAA